MSTVLSAMVGPSKFEITYKEIEHEITGEVKTFPKYTSAILNLANYVSGATRPSIVGQMTELVKECPYKTYDEWKPWYRSRKPQAIAQASAKVRDMLEKLTIAMKQIDEKMVSEWLEDLVLVKTFAGLKFQSAILSRLAKMKATSYRLATPAEESKGIDGFVGEIPVSIKPKTYKMMARLPESIRIPVVFYDKTKQAIEVDAENFLGKDGVLV